VKGGELFPGSGRESNFLQAASDIHRCAGAFYLNMPKKTRAQKTSKKKAGGAGIETGFRILDNIDVRTPFSGPAGIPPDRFMDQGLGGDAWSDLPYGRPTDNQHPDGVSVKGLKDAYEPSAKLLGRKKTGSKSKKRKKAA
jgi:hypothetical protein